MTTTAMSNQQVPGFNSLGDSVDALRAKVLDS